MVRDAEGGMRLEIVCDLFHDKVKNIVGVQ